jgi:hypothetical protein
MSLLDCMALWDELKVNDTFDIEENNEIINND